MLGTKILFLVQCLPRCPTLSAQAGHVTQRRLLGLPWVLEDMPFERVESMGCGEEPACGAVHVAKPDGHRRR
jgi:hypothetical protein